MNEFPRGARDPAGTRPSAARAVVIGSACDACLRRTDLIAAVAGSIDVAWREKRGRTARVLALPDADLLGLDPAAAARYERFDAAEARRRIADAGLIAVCRCRPDYPQRLRELPDPPAVLHVAGSLAALPERRGRRDRRRAAGHAVRARGLALARPWSHLRGASGRVRHGARDRFGRPRRGARGVARGARPAAPVAVLAGGAETPYPARMRGLHARLIEAGAVVSEMPPGFTAHRWCFPARNRIIAALSTITIVVEAATKSGSLITADLATDLGRVIAAVPGPVTSRYSAGSNELLHAGAAVIRDARDALDLAFGADAPALPPPASVAPLDPAQRRVLDAIERGDGTLAELATTMDEARAASRTLSELELLGLVRRGFGGRYVRCS